MNATSFVGYFQRARSKLRLAVSDDHRPHFVALSFAVGIFCTTLPNLGISILVLLWVSRRFAWAHTLAFLSAIAIMNPLVKGAVYPVSFLLGVQLLGPVPGLTNVEIGLDVGVAALGRLLVGNVILAAGFALLGYAVTYILARHVRQRNVPDLSG
jgi:uncharacterized protein (DUF2062 family)